MPRYGFGEQTGETEKGGKPQFEHGHIEVSNQAFKYATQEYPETPPKAAVGLLMAEDWVPEGVDIDYEYLHELLQDLENIGESTADDILEAVQKAVQAD